MAASLPEPPLSEVCRTGRRAFLFHRRRHGQTAFFHLPPGLRCAIMVGYSRRPQNVSPAADTGACTPGVSAATEYAPVMELADMRDLGSRAFSVWVRVPSGAPYRGPRKRNGLRGPRLYRHFFHLGASANMRIAHRATLLHPVFGRRRRIAPFFACVKTGGGLRNFFSVFPSKRIQPWRTTAMRKQRRYL